MTNALSLHYGQGGSGHGEVSYKVIKNNTSFDKRYAPVSGTDFIDLIKQKQ